VSEELVYVCLLALKGNKRAPKRVFISKGSVE
jgi:hypothetical protein